MIYLERKSLPSGLFLDRVVFDDGHMDYFITREGTDELWDRGLAVSVTQEEYDALKPLAKPFETIGKVIEWK